MYSIILALLTARSDFWGSTTKQKFIKQQFKRQYPHDYGLTKQKRYFILNFQ